MAGAVPVQPEVSRKRKSVDAELNLVPSIDLLSCLISFLLITAVWTQIAAVRAQTTGTLRQAPDDARTPAITIRVNLTDRGYTLSLQNEVVEIPKVGGIYDVDRLVEKLKFVKERIPEQTQATVAPDDDIPYEQVTAPSIELPLRG